MVCSQQLKCMCVLWLALQVQQLLSTVARAAQGSSDQQAVEQGPACSSGCYGRTSSSDGPSATAPDASGGQASGTQQQQAVAMAAVAATGSTAADGVVQLSPEDVEAWARVQRTKQQA